MARLYKDSGLFTIPEFKNRGIIKLAPDVLVYIAGDVGSVIVAPASGKDQKVDFNDGITAVSVQNNVDPPGSSSASIEITTPIYGENSKYWLPYKVDGKIIRAPVFVPMMEVKIFFKGRYLVNGEPKYYPSFWGFISNVEENYSGGVYKVNIQCVDMLHWWAYSQVNIHPVPESNIAFGGGQTMTAFKTIFRDANPFTIMWRLATDMYVPKKTQEEQIEQAAAHRFIAPTWVAQRTPRSQIIPSNVLRSAAIGIMTYWKQRFNNLGSLLKMYGANDSNRISINTAGNRVDILRPNRTRKIDDPDTSKKKRASRSLIVDEFDVNKDLNRFAVFFEFDKMGEFSEAEYLSKLEIATEIKNRIEYEFFQDVDGNFIFKPPFYNMDVRGVEPYNIRSYDIINSSFQLDSEGIVTVLQVTTPFHGAIRDPKTVPSRGYHMDIDLAKRYGIRQKEIHVEYITTRSDICNQLALGHLSVINAKCYTGSVSMPGRPELKLGYPVYIDYKDSFYYVRSINHSFDYGGSFTTSLSLEAERKRIIDFDTGEILRDKVYRFNGEIDPSEAALTKNDEKKRELKQSTGEISSINQGRYIVSDRMGKGVNHQQLRDLEMTVTKTTVPFTDSDGYRLIGSFKYGRGVAMTGSTSLTDIIGTTLDSSSYLVEQKYEKLTFEAPRSAAEESQKMGSFFNQIKDNEENIVPSYLDTKNFRLAVNEETGNLTNPSQTTFIIPSGYINEPSSKLVNYRE